MISETNGTLSMQRVLTYDSMKEIMAGVSSNFDKCREDISKCTDKIDDIQDAVTKHFDDLNAKSANQDAEIAILVKSNTLLHERVTDLENHLIKSNICLSALIVSIALLLCGLFGYNYYRANQRLDQLEENNSAVEEYVDGEVAVE